MQSVKRRLSSRIKCFGVELSPDNIAVAMVYFVQGVLGLSRLAVSFYLKDDLHLDPAETAVISGFSALPWLVKPLYGFIRRSYLVLSGLLGALSWSLMATLVDSKYSAAFCILLGSLSVAFSDVVSGWVERLGHLESHHEEAWWVQMPEDLMVVDSMVVERAAVSHKACQVLFSLYVGVLQLLVELSAPTSVALWWMLMVSDFCFTTVSGTALGMTQVFLVTGLNRKFGISDEWFAIGDSLILTVLAQHTNSSSTALLVYVDDVILAGNDMTEIASVKSFLNQTFRIKDLGTLKFFLGLEIARNSKGMVINQRKYALEILSDARYLASKPVSTPMDSSLKLSKTSVTFVSAVLWNLWNSRNVLLWNVKDRSPEGIVSLAHSFLVQWRAVHGALTLQSSCGNDDEGVLCWEKLRMGGVKCNIDAAVLRQEGTSRDKIKVAHSLVRVALFHASPNIWEECQSSLISALVSDVSPEDCTQDYISEVKAKFDGKWLCGLCSEAVRDEVSRGKKQFGMEEAVRAHMSFCGKFNSNPAVRVADGMRQMLRRRSGVLSSSPSSSK
ncbi:hypothetical protein GH714_019935 [Hevea brasiliensis]|uniref:Reverse transcriptase Ty1/copia-type domain-containing protein n=1 Tax=Hevea brasiliensis TaxID=3981 RepID=A0A6A6K800_HEVBR|nr:hypothetical protein GH714_019935 [Hevea brasiliensis]